MHLVLFDIDGTLLREGIAPRVAFARALRETYDTIPPLSGFSFAGMTDPQCVNEIMRSVGLNDDVILQRRDDCLIRYVEHLAVEMQHHNGATLFPGVRELLDRLGGREDVLVGLLTGNVSRGAALKLRRFGLEPYFRFGAYGDDHENRSALAQIALERASGLAGLSLSGAQTTVVGDTPRDVECARAIGARAVLVMTGVTSPDELCAANPDAILDSFQDIEAALRAILP